MELALVFLAYRILRWFVGFFFFWKICEPLKYDKIEVFVLTVLLMYEGHLESKERFAIQRYLLIRGKKKNMQVL